MVTKVPRGALVATLVGNTLEFYDFIAYTFLAVYIGRAYFPTDSELASLLLSVATFGIGFLTRPLGGVLIGAYADRAGRKPALLLTITLMAVGTLAIVVTPSYASIGIAAPLILVVARLVQGFALGGEVGPASAVLLEAAPPDKRVLYISLQSASQGVAMVFAGIVGVIVTSSLSAAELGAWGWRVPLAVGLVIVPVGIYMRRALPETLPEPKHDSAASAFRAVWRDHAGAISLLVLILSCSTISSYVVNYMTTYGQTALGMPPTVAMVAPIAGGLTGIVSALATGPIAERFGRARTVIVSRIATIVLALPLFLYLSHERSLAALIIVVVIFVAISQPAGVAGLTVIAEQFPTELRSIGISLAYALTVTIFGSTTQFVVAWLIGVTGDPLAPAYYVMATGLVSIAAMVALMRRRQLGESVSR